MPIELKKLNFFSYYSKLSWSVACTLLFLSPVGANAQGYWTLVPPPIQTTSTFLAFTPLDLTKNEGTSDEVEKSCGRTDYCYDHIKPDIFPEHKLYFKPSAKIQTATLEKLAGAYAQMYPAAKNDIYKVFLGEGAGLGKNNLIQKMKPLLWQRSMRVDNLAHAYTIFSISQYEAATGAQVGNQWVNIIAPIQHQSERFLLNMPVANNSDAEKQALAEELLILAAMTQGSATYIKQHPEAKAQYQQSAKDLAKVYGLDFDKLVLTEIGFMECRAKLRSHVYSAVEYASNC